MYKIYVVEYGDTLSSIANKFGISNELLNRINGNITNLIPGMQIVVPANSDNPFITYVVEKGESIYQIARKNGVDYKDVLLINGLDENDYIYPNQELIIPKEGYMVYITEENDTLNDIASRLNIKKENIISQNGTIYLMPNQVIIYKKEKTI